jgi:hypothetical protein
MENNEVQKPSEIIRYIRLERLTVYEISEDELNNLEHGPPAPLLLSIALFLLGAAVTITATLFSVEIKDLKTYCIFMICMIIGYVVGVILLIITIIQIRKNKSVGKAIRDRAKRFDGGSQQVIEGITEEGK